MYAVQLAPLQSVPSSLRYWATAVSSVRTKATEVDRVYVGSPEFRTKLELGALESQVKPPVPKVVWMFPAKSVALTSME